MWACLYKCVYIIFSLVSLCPCGTKFSKPLCQCLAKIWPSNLQERVADPSAKPSASLAARPVVPPYAPPMLPMDDDEVSYKGFYLF